jgi:hypothetical protein
VYKCRDKIILDAMHRSQSYLTYSLCKYESSCQYRTVPHAAQQFSEIACEQTDRQRNGWMDGWMDGWTDGRTDRQTERQVGEWLDGWTDGWTDGQTASTVHAFNRRILWKERIKILTNEIVKI